MRIELTTDSQRQVMRHGVRWMFIVEHHYAGTVTWIARRWTGVQWQTEHFITF